MSCFLCCSIEKKGPFILELADRLKTDRDSQTRDKHHSQMPSTVTQQIDYRYATNYRQKEGTERDVENSNLSSQLDEISPRGNVYVFMP